MKERFAWWLRFHAGRASWRLRYVLSRLLMESGFWLVHAGTGLLTRHGKGALS